MQNYGSNENLANAKKTDIKFHDEKMNVNDSEQIVQNNNIANKVSPIVHPNQLKIRFFKFYFHFFQSPNVSYSNGTPEPKAWEGLKRRLSSVKKEKLLSLENKLPPGCNLSESSSMEEVMRQTLKAMKIRNVAWISTNQSKSYQIMFSMESSIACEDFLRIMNDWGIGEREGTSISLMPCTFYHNPHVESPEPDDDNKK